MHPNSTSVNTTGGIHLDSHSEEVPSIAPHLRSKTKPQQHGGTHRHANCAAAHSGTITAPTLTIHSKKQPYHSGAKPIEPAAPNLAPTQLLLNHRQRPPHHSPSLGPPARTSQHSGSANFVGHQTPTARDGSRTHNHQLESGRRLRGDDRPITNGAKPSHLVVTITATTDTRQHSNNHIIHSPPEATAKGHGRLTLTRQPRTPAPISISVRLHDDRLAFLHTRRPARPASRVALFAARLHPVPHRSAHGYAASRDEGPDCPEEL